jgi:hypothetical protein
MREHTATHADDLDELISDRAVNGKALIPATGLHILTAVGRIAVGSSGASSTCSRTTAWPAGPRSGSTAVAKGKERGHRGTLVPAD